MEFRTSNDQGLDFLKNPTRAFMINLIAEISKHSLDLATKQNKNSMIIILFMIGCLPLSNIDHHHKSCKHAIDKKKKEDQRLFFWNRKLNIENKSLFLFRFSEHGEYLSSVSLKEKHRVCTPLG
jgi:hypothetical protein